MSFLDLRALRVGVTVLLLVGVVALVYALRHLLLLFALAVFLAYLIFPLVKSVQRWVLRGGHRTSAIALVYLLLLVALAGVGASVGPRLSGELGTLAEKLPEMSQKLRSGELVGSVLERRGWGDEAIEQAQRFVGMHGGGVVGYAQKVAAGVLRWLTGAWTIVLIPIFAFFLLKDAERITEGAVSLLETRRHRQLWRGIGADLHRLLGEYVRALILLSVITFVVWSIGFLVAGVPYALVLAAIAGALEFIPVVGPIGAGVLVVTVSLLAGYGHPWLLAGFVLLWRGVQDYVTSPLVMGQGVEIHPLLVIFGVIAGGELAGVAGMFFSVPVIAGVRVLWRRAQAFEKARTEAAAVRAIETPPPDVPSRAA